MGTIKIPVGIAVVAGLCYWFEWYQLAFWFLIYAVVYGGLDAVREIIRARSPLFRDRSFK
jgi:hypothetical protein